MYKIQKSIKFPLKWNESWSIILLSCANSIKANPSSPLANETALHKVLSDCTSSLLVFFCLKIQTAAFKEPARLMTQLIKQCVATKMMFIQEHSGGFRYWSRQAVGMWHTMLILLPEVSGSSDKAALPFLSQQLISYDALSKQNGKTSEKCIWHRSKSKQNAGDRSGTLPSLDQEAL